MRYMWHVTCHCRIISSATATPFFKDEIFDTNDWFVLLFNLQRLICSFLVEMIKCNLTSHMGTSTIFLPILCWNLVEKESNFRRALFLV